MIIVEGCDNSGKTTLASRLASDFNLLYVKAPRPKRDIDVFKYQNTMVDLSLKYPAIFDRWPSFSEPVYGPICRNQSILTNHMVEVLHKTLARVRPLIIYCRPDSPAILNLGSRAQMDGVRINIERLIEAYDREMLAAARYYPNILTHDYERDSYERLCQTLKENHYGI